MNVLSNSDAFSLPASAPSNRWQYWAPTFVTVILFWLMVLNQQRLEWSVNPVYSYGWVVPLLAGYLFWSRWLDRPTEGKALGAGWFWGGILFSLATYLPLRAIQEANPDWVKVNWSMALLWIGMTLLILSRMGGARYAGHFLYPLLFCCTALPWPVWMEETLTQNLMRLNATVSAEMLTLFGTPAVAQGNLIQVGDHWVNVEEACSGIRSLQTAFMTALFLGEFYRMSWLRRGALLVASFAVAFIVNLIRTIVLSGLAQGDAINTWHDTVGIVAMALCLALLWWLAESIKGAERKTPANVLERNNPARPAVRAPLKWRSAATICLWLFAAEGLVWGWYHAHERTLAPPMAWKLNWPREAPAFAEGKFADRMSALLKFNEGTTASWQTPEGSYWQMYYLQWYPGRVSKFLSSAHYPTVCLPANGLTLVSETGVWHCAIDGVDVPFTTYVFDEGGRDVYVFHAVIEDRPTTSGPRLSYRQVSSAERIDSVLRGERNLGQRVVGIAVRGPFSPSDARVQVADTLASLINIKPLAAGTGLASSSP